jgi:hypothetical protein
VLDAVDVGPLAGQVAHGFFAIGNGLEALAYRGFHPGATHQKNLVVVVLWVEDRGMVHEQESSTSSIMTASRFFPSRTAWALRRSPESA